MFREKQKTHRSLVIIEVSRPFLKVIVKNEISCKLTYSWNLVVKFHWKFKFHMKLLIFIK